MEVFDSRAVGRLRITFAAVASLALAAGAPGGALAAPAPQCADAPGLVAAAGSGGVLLTSPDGITPSSADSGVTGLLWGETHSGSQLVFSGQGSTVISSSDGVGWNPVATRPPATGIRALSIFHRSVVGVGDLDAHMRLPR